MIENLDLRRRAELELRPAEVSRRHPHLVHVAIADFGLSGPRAGWRLEALPAFAASGALYASGFPELAPCWLPGYAAHDSASVFAVAGALAALVARRRDGVGQTVEVSVQEAALHGLNPWSIPLADYAGAIRGCRRARGETATAPITCSPPRTVGFARSSGRRVTGADSSRCSAIPKCSPDRSGRSNAVRLANQDVIRLVASEILRSRPPGEVLAEARRLDVPMVPVNSPDEFVAEEQTRGRGNLPANRLPASRGRARLRGAVPLLDARRFTGSPGAGGRFAVRDVGAARSREPQCAREPRGGVRRSPACASCTSASARSCPSSAVCWASSVRK